MQLSFQIAAVVLAALAAASPVEQLNDRDLTPAQCSKVATVVSVLSSNQATPFCSSFLKIKTKTSTITVTETTSVVKTATITAGTATTSIVFKPGNPPTSPIKARENLHERAAAPAAEPFVKEPEATPTVPAYATAYPISAISDGCECLKIPKPTTTVTKTSTKTFTSTGTITATIPLPVVTSTVYPCATPAPYKTPTLPYGRANNAGVDATQNALYDTNSEYNSIEGCCNLCFFIVPNCIQAFYYSYQGCVVMQAIAPLGIGIGVSDVCPAGQIAGLTYNPDSNIPFRSTGDIAGPCGMVYNNL